MSVLSIFLSQMRLWLLAFLLCCLQGRAQNQLEVGLGRGFLIPHRAVMQHLQQGHSTKISLSYTKDQSSSDWGSKFNKPTTGVSLHFLSLGNNKELGHAIGVQYQFACNLGKRKSALRYTLGAGLGLLTKRYGVDNEKNIAIGSRLNSSIFMELSKFWELGKYQLGTGLAINHFSNASFSTPNLGINIPSINLYFSRSPQSYARPNSTDRTSLIIQNPAELELSLDFGLRQVSVVDDNRYVASSLVLRYSLASKRISQLDLFLLQGLNQGIPASIENEVDVTTGQRPTVAASAAYQSGIGLGYRINFGNTKVFIQQGYYLYSKQPGIGNLFHRVGVNQKISKKVNLNITLRSHFAKAEYLGFGFGYNFLAS